MRVSKLYAPTLREVPAEAEVVSHQLMLRAGFMRKAAGGIYTYLPLAWRVLKKIERIVREEMDAKGSQELLMPIVQPAEIWQESGRWDVYGAEMFRLQDRHNRCFCLGPTHEEMVTTLIRGDVRSYRQLPLSVYQIQNKYRDERRPRFGLMRGREFIMKDAYSFDRDEAGLDKSYQDMYDAYTNIFTRCGLNFRPVEADSGAIGGSGSHEFMVIADSGEAEIVFCTSCDYAANVEKAELFPLEAQEEAMLTKEEVVTPDCKTIADVCAYLKLPVDHSVKAVAYNSEKGLILCFVRGDHEVNEIKVINTCGVIDLEMATEEQLAAAGTVGGYMGPVGIDNKKVIVVVDATVMKMHNVCCGANKEGYHFINVNPGRDFTPTYVADIRLIQEGDPCPHCGGEVSKARGIEVGQVFKLFTKYSSALKATYLDENGKEQPMVMGCYGVGVSRTMAAAIEQNYDDNGIIWPIEIAPYHVLVVPVNTKDEASAAKAEEIYMQLKKVGLETVIDDRNERPGVKFKDADLIGYPLRVVVGPKTLTEGKLEVKIRKTGEIIYLPLDGDYVQDIKNIIAELAFSK
ncbi:proline--tRNA ligase [Phascolarctobacterium faecium]|jgi:prolyl-tRNA synthetase|uniref:proline--tRNA ligase n=1 Tax=Phascolarctobacterium faecium TaxID=33025 RepID=UPI00242B4E2F|nr:proline--tRNA ligase [Phascolarctobacterium faecium]MBS1316317.1 proline--tRNA ligase [Acidaminococcaceae bacterium]